MSVRLLSLTAAILAGLSLSACTNARKDNPGLSIIKNFVTPKSKDAVVSDPQQIAAAVNESLNAYSGPLALATFEKTNNNVVLRQITSNGPYKTWANLGSAERRSITMRNGVITSTRGLIRDLMSSDIEQSLALISARRSGQVTRVQRYLDSENKISEVRANCTISRGGQAQVQVGHINRVATEMVESCQDGDRSFKNIYRVDSGGRVLQSVQWLNPFYGTTVVQQLR